MTVPRHTLIRQRREQLGISVSELARRIGLKEESMYWDVGFHEDELTGVLPLRNARALAKVLELDLRALLGVDPRNRSGAIAGKPRHLVLTEARDRIGVSVSQMANDIAFEDWFVQLIEGDSQAIEKWPYEVLTIVAAYLKLDPADLVDEPSIQKTSSSKE